MRLLSAAFVLSVLFACLACAGGSPSSLDGNGQRPGLDTGLIGLPVPSGLPETERETSALAAIQSQLGSHLDEGLPNANITIDGSRAAFDASWDGSGTDGLAYGMYWFVAGDGTVAPEVHLTWHEQPADFGDVYIGMANWDADSWSWFQASGSTIDVGEMATFQDFTNQVLVVVVLAATDSAKLNRVQIGAVPENEGWTHSWGQTDNDVFLGVASDNIFSTYAVTERGKLARYDMDGNLLWVVDCDGAGNARLDFVTVGQDFLVYVVGGTADVGEGGLDVLVQCYSTSGFVLWSRTWGTADDDYARGLAFDGTGLYILAESINTAGPVVVPSLLKFGTGGNLFWQKQIGSGTYNLAKGLDVSFPGGGPAQLHAALKLNVGVDNQATYIRADAAGDLELAKKWDPLAGEGVDFTSVAAVPGTSDVFIAANTTKSGWAADKVAVIQYNGTSDFVKQMYYSSVDQPFTASGIDVDVLGNMVLAGYHKLTGTDYSGIALSLDLTGGVSELWDLAESGQNVILLNCLLVPDFGALVTGFGQAATNSSWTNISVTSEALPGEWVDATVEWGDAAGVASAQALTPESVVDGVVDTGGGQDDAVISLVTEI